MSKKKGHGINYRRLAEVSSVGLMLPSSIAIGLFFGHTLDKLLGTHPWMLMIFFFFGIVSGFLSLFRGLNRLKAFSPDDEELNNKS